MNFSEFPIYKFRVTFTVKRMFKFSSFHGTALNGILGRALMKISKQAYFSVFRIPAPDDFEHKRKMPFLPPPLVIKPPLLTKEIYYEGDEYCFDFLLIGNSIAYLRDVLFAFLKIEKFTIGERIIEPRGIIHLKTVEWYKNDDTLQTLIAPSQVLPYEIKTDTIAPGTFSRIQIQFTTPVDFGKSELPQKLDFTFLIRRLHGRLQWLNRFYAPEFVFVEEEAKQMQEAAANVEMQQCRFIPRTVIHSRVKEYKAHIGMVRYAGQMHEYLPMLRLFEQIHAGSETSSGLGGMEVRTKN